MNISIDPKSKDRVQFDIALNLYNNAKLSIDLINSSHEEIYIEFIETNRKRKGQFVRTGFLNLGFKRLKNDEMDHEVHCRIWEFVSLWDNIPWELMKNLHETKLDICKQYVKMFESGLPFTLSYEEYNAVKCVLTDKF